MGKKNKKKHKQKHEQNYNGISPEMLALFNAIDLKTMFEESEKDEWIYEDHSPVENYFHERAKIFGR